MKIRKAILTGGGRATRPHPITTTTNKHVLPLANKPMIFHAIEKVVEAGVRDIFINTNPGETELQKYVGDGGHWGVNIRFFEQTGGPQGIAHVVHLAESFIGSDPFLFYLSDNILFGSLHEMIDSFHREEYDCMLALSKVPDPNRFGVPVFDDSGRMTDVLEKPSVPPSDFAVTGVYLYGPNVFFDAFRNIEKSGRGEYEISSIHSYLLKQKFHVGYKEITGWWKDTGKPDDLLLANKLLLDHMSEDQFVVASDSGRIQDNGYKVHIGGGSVIGEGVTMEGPVMIGENCMLRDCHVGPYVTIGTGTEIIGGRIERSIILEGASIHWRGAIQDSIIGKGVVVRGNKNDPGACSMILGDKTVLQF